MNTFVSFYAIDILKNSPPEDLKLDLVSFGSFEYDYISDDEIKESILSGRPKKIDLNKTWMTKKATKQIHIDRVAAVVLLVDSGIEFDPVEMEVSPYNFNLSFVVDGHHRIRAYQYLKLKGFWASLGGDFSWMEEFSKFCSKY